MMLHDMFLNFKGPPPAEYALEYYRGTYVRNTDFTINLTNAPDDYRYAFISAEMGQAATGVQYPIAFEVNGVASTTVSAQVSNDGNSSASATSAHTLVRIPFGNTMTVKVSHGYPVNGGYHIGIFRLPFLNYTFSSQTSGGAGSSYGPFSITEYTNGLVLATFRGSYGTAEAISFTGITRLEGSADGGVLAGGYAFSTSDGSRSVSVSHGSTDLRVSVVSSWTAS